MCFICILIDHNITRTKQRRKEIRLEYQFFNENSLTYSKIQISKRCHLEKYLDEIIEYIKIDSIINVQRRINFTRIILHNQYKYNPIYLLLKEHCPDPKIRHVYGHKRSNTGRLRNIFYCKPGRCFTTVCNENTACIRPYTAQIRYRMRYRITVIKITTKYGPFPCRISP